MTKTDFAELKEKLTKFDVMALSAEYIECCKRRQYNGLVRIEDMVKWQHSKDSAIISELIDIIQSQSEALDHVNEFCLCKRNTFGFDYHEDHPVQGLPKSGSRWLTPRDRIKSSLSETTTRLQKLRDGNSGKKINAEDLVKNQEINAGKWAAAFMQIFGSDLRRIDEGLMISWFANAIMVAHDKISNAKDAETQQLKSKLAKAKYEIKFIIENPDQDVINLLKDTLSEICGEI